MRIKILLLLTSFLFLCSFTSLKAQVEKISPVTALPQAKSITESFNRTKKSSVSLPFFDDFSDRLGFPNPNLWLDSNAYVNNNFAEKPITIGVITFDGLDKYGYAYDITDERTDTADILTSVEIDLSVTVDTVILSFYIQEAGLGEVPESNDSIMLEFYDPTAMQWNWIWGKVGTETNGTFHRVFIPILDSKYLVDNFQFRFISFGSQAGAFDQWNLDYVNLDQNRRTIDTLFRDPAFTRAFPSLLKNYESMPWFHFQGNESVLLEDSVRHYYRNNWFGTNNLDLGRNLTLGPSGGVIGNIPVNPNLDATHGYNVEENYPQALGPLTFTSPSNEFELRSFSSYSGINLLTSNDTLKRVQSFRNYYSYDDGTAERAYGLEDGNGKYILVKYDLFGTATIRGLYLYFLPTEIDITDNSFTIAVFQNNNGLPGSLIYESDSLYTPEFTDHNFYLPYQLDDSTKSLTGSVFIGIKQSKTAKLNQGYDLNSPEYTTAFFGEPGDWFQSFAGGNIMMRPFFNYLPTDLTIEEISIINSPPFFYPNPAVDILKFEAGHEEVDYEIYDSSSRLVKFGKCAEDVDISNFKSGFYIIRFRDEELNTQTFKLLKQ